MPYTITVPDNYGYVILSTVVNTLFITPMYMGGKVMTARKQFNVQYPNLYAVPGFHKDADAFNRVQRGHQNMFEGLPGAAIMLLIGGLKYPLANAVYGVLFSAGSILYQVGYSGTSLDVKGARYEKGGMLKWVGFFGALGSTISLAGSMIGWW